MDSFLIKEKILSGNWAMSKHAHMRAGQRKVKDTEVVTAIANGEIIEDYPTDAGGIVAWCWGISGRVGRCTLFAGLILRAH